MHQLPALPSNLTVAAIAIACAFITLVSRSLYPVAGFVVFWWTAGHAAAELSKRLPLTLDGQDLQVSGWVDDFPQVDARRTRFSLRIDEMPTMPVAGSRLRLSWYNVQVPPRPGQQLRLTVRLRQPHGFMNPGGFDYERWLFVNGYIATGYVRELQSEPSDHSSLSARVLRWRASMLNRLQDTVNKPRPRALMAALSIGERSGFTDEDWAVFRRTGTSHLVAISGLHIGLLAGFVYWLVSRLALRSSAWVAELHLECATVSSLSVAFVYAACAGFALPTQRAFLMLAFLAGVVMSRRSVNALHTLALSGLAIVCIDPLATLTASFWMSFGAVGILLLAGAVKQHGKIAKSIRSRLAAMARIQMQITVALLPVTVMFFGGFSVVAVLVNFFAIPLFSFVLVPLVLIATFTASFWSFGNLPMAVAQWIASQAIAALNWAASPAWASVDLAGVSVAAVVIATLGAVLAQSWHGGRLRLVSACSLLAVLIPNGQEPPHGYATMTVLDVGHGLAVVVETASHVLLYDAGASSITGFDVGDALVVPQLARRDRLDMLVVSHSDNDHSGGAGAVLSAYSNASVLHGSDVLDLGGRPCVGGTNWQWDGVEFEIVHPNREFVGSDNDGSCVLKIVTANQVALLTGDIELRGEAAVVSGANIRADVVVVPHHGSATSSSASFVNSVSPDIAVVSAGYRNRWGFPAETVVARWQNGGAKVLVTGELGAIRLVLGGAIMQAQLERELRRRYWHNNAGLYPGESASSTL